MSILKKKGKEEAAVLRLMDQPSVGKCSFQSVLVQLSENGGLRQKWF